MEIIKLPIYSREGKEVDTLQLDGAVFDGVVNEKVIYQAVLAYNANQRKGLAATKTRGEVSGGGKKPWKQKGTGRARVGSIRSPLWRHGGVVFGPHPHSFSYCLPEKIKNSALKSSLNLKVKENNFIILEDFKLDKAKTKEANSIFVNLKADGKKENSALLLLEAIDKNIKLAVRNLKFLKFALAKDTHVYDVMAYKKIVITKAGLTELIKRLKK